VITAALGLTHLGILCLYAASPSSPVDALGSIRSLVSAGSLRGVGALALGAGLVLAVLGGPVGEGLLVWGAMAMASCSFAVIAGPLARRLLWGTALLAVVVAAVAPWT
jgi:hypothetical protein